MENYKILYANRFRFPDKSTGEVIEKATVQYLSKVPVKDSNGNTKGQPAVTVPCPYELLDKLTVLPGDYRVTFSVTLDNRGRPVQRIEDVELAK